MTGESAMVANPRKAALARALEAARPEAAGATTALDEAVSAMKSKAWESGAADSFFAALTAGDNDAGRAGQDCLDALRQAHDRQPDQVPASRLPNG
ncbi:MAG: hypothetical protein QG622_16 [Actinomycetota bacterium]|nr:hypothetical protein [Actinomycetota bacterium]